MKTMKLEVFSEPNAALQDEVKLTGIAGEWRDLENHKQFPADTGAVLNWWQSTGTISFQGFAAEELEAKLFCVATGEDDREIIPPELLAALTADRIDWERSTLIDDEGRLWSD